MQAAAAAPAQQQDAQPNQSGTQPASEITAHPVTPTPDHDETHSDGAGADAAAAGTAAGASPGNSKRSVHVTISPQLPTQGGSQHLCTRWGGAWPACHACIHHARMYLVWQLLSGSLFVGVRKS